MVKPPPMAETVVKLRVAPRTLLVIRVLVITRVILAPCLGAAPTGPVPVPAGPIVVLGPKPTSQALLLKTVPVLIVRRAPSLPALTTTVVALVLETLMPLARVIPVAPPGPLVDLDTTKWTAPLRSMLPVTPARAVRISPAATSRATVVLRGVKPVVTRASTTRPEVPPPTAAVPPVPAPTTSPTTAPRPLLAVLGAKPVAMPASITPRVTPAPTAAVPLVPVPITSPTTVRPPPRAPLGAKPAVAWVTITLLVTPVRTAAAPLVVPANTSRATVPLVHLVPLGPPLAPMASPT